MGKKEYLEELRRRLEEVGASSVDNMVSFYDEAISDRIEDGKTEEEAVSEMDSIDEIIRTVKLEMPMPTVVRNKIKEGRRSSKEKGNGVLLTVLAIVGFPLWGPLVLAAAIIVFAIYITLWSLVVALYAVDFAFGLSAVAGIVGAITFFGGVVTGPTAVFMLAFALFLGGLTVLLWKPLAEVSKGLIRLIQLFVKSIKKLFV